MELEPCPKDPSLPQPDVCTIEESEDEELAETSRGVPSTQGSQHLQAHHATRRPLQSPTRLPPPSNTTLLHSLAAVNSDARMGNTFERLIPSSERSPASLIPSDSMLLTTLQPSARVDGDSRILVIRDQMNELLHICWGTFQQWNLCSKRI